MVVDLVQGEVGHNRRRLCREEIEQTEIERLNTYDYDQTPLAAGDRKRWSGGKAEEALLEASLKERRSASQARIREIEQRLMEEREISDSLDQSLPGPWRASHLDSQEQ